MISLYINSYDKIVCVCRSGITNSWIKASGMSYYINWLCIVRIAGALVAILLHVLCRMNIAIMIALYAKWIFSPPRLMLGCSMCFMIPTRNWTRTIFLVSDGFFSLLCKYVKYLKGVFLISSNALFSSPIYRTIYFPIAKVYIWQVRVETV